MILRFIIIMRMIKGIIAIRVMIMIMIVKIIAIVIKLMITRYQ